MSQLTPLACFVIKYALRSFKKIENKKRERFSPCLTTGMHGKNINALSFATTLEFILLYIFCISVKHLPFILCCCNFSHYLSLHTESNACLKATKQHSNLLLFLSDFIISIKLLMINILPEVECYLRNPAWHGSINSLSSENVFNLLLMIAVNNVPRLPI